MDDLDDLLGSQGWAGASGAPRRAWAAPAAGGADAAGWRAAWRGAGKRPRAERGEWDRESEPPGADADARAPPGDDWLGDGGGGWSGAAARPPRAASPAAAAGRLEPPAERRARPGAPARAGQAPLLPHGGGGSEPAAAPSADDGDGASEDEGAEAPGGEGGGDDAGALVAADFGLGREAVMARIEALALQLAADAAAGRLPALACVSTAASNVHFAGAADTWRGADHQGGSQASQAAEEEEAATQQPEEQEEEEEGSQGGGGADAGAAQHVLRLGSRVQLRTLTGSGGAQAASVVRGGRRLRARRARGPRRAAPATSHASSALLAPGPAAAAPRPARAVLALLDVVHGLLAGGRSATQRDIYYTLLGPPYFAAPRHVTSAITAALGLLRVPRASLGIAAASKGAVAGRLLLRPRPGEPWQDCSLVGPAGRAIPGEVGAIDAMALRRVPAGAPAPPAHAARRSRHAAAAERRRPVPPRTRSLPPSPRRAARRPVGARFVLVVEKDAVFARLVEDRLHEALPCVLLTGRGMPDLASRAFLAALVAACARGGDPAVPVLGLVDWNPGGAAILAAYKFGSAAMGLEGARYAVPQLAWLGATREMLADVPRSACQALGRRDRAVLPGLAARFAGRPAWLAELAAMEEGGLKADLEALYHVHGAAGLSAEVSRRALARRYLPP
ncbi:SPO11-2 [Scenedesmus sp. PABB004]|nr:SPO11-2 [Scenedesmus sp. PABB004]